MDFSQKLKSYANLIVSHGLNIQKGQILNISAEVYHRNFAYLIAEEAYQQGASFVNIDLIEPRLHRLRILSSSLEDLQYVPPYVDVKYRELVDTSAANLKILGSENPDILADLDPKKLNTARLATYKAIQYFYEEGIGKSKLHWTIAAAATPAWGKKIFPDKTPAEAETLLWEQIFNICRVNEERVLEAWKAHNDILQTRARKLTELEVDYLHFTGGGTDLKVGLSEKAIFKGGGDMSPRKVEFEPNIPTEECFTTPDYRRTEGHVKATRPFLINGKMIRGLSLEFTSGEISSFKAEEGEDTFREYINSDAGAKRLGEVALVGIDSPVYQSGLVFEEILFDENAACHIAVGSSYKFCLAGGESMEKSELEKIGANESSVHTDMMISSAEVDVKAYTRAGKEVLLIEKGAWKDF